MTTPSPDLVAWLRLQLDEDERIARAASDVSPDWSYVSMSYGPRIQVGEPRKGIDREDANVWDREVNEQVWDCDDEMDGCPESARAWAAEGKHIATWDPARVLAEVESKRLILDAYEAMRVGADAAEGTLLRGASLVRLGAYERCVRALALPYRDREGYREEWAV